MFLTPEALRALTGCARKTLQIEQLRAMGVPFWINRAGRPVVACSALDGSRAAPEKEPAGWKPAVLSAHR